MKRDDMKITITIKTSDVPIGHTPHKSGTGAHKDKRSKRNRTRKNQRENHIKEYD